MTYTTDICRAKRLDAGEWVYGDLITQDYPIFKDLKAPLILNTDGVWEINPATKCRCTGKTDTNGDMIFERDIIKDRNERVLFVKYEDCKFKITDEYDNGVETTQEAIDWFEFKIIGNTIDNKNLLGGK